MGTAESSTASHFIRIENSILDVQYAGTVWGCIKLWQLQKSEAQL